jgi:hypothetical protein
MIAIFDESEKGLVSRAPFLRRYAHLLNEVLQDVRLEERLVQTVAARIDAIANRNDLPSNVPSML